MPGCHRRSPRVECRCDDGSCFRHGLKGNFATRWSSAPTLRLATVRIRHEECCRSVRHQCHSGHWWSSDVPVNMALCLTPFVCVMDRCDALQDPCPSLHQTLSLYRSTVPWDTGITTEPWSLPQRDWHPIQDASLTFRAGVQTTHVSTQVPVLCNTTRWPANFHFAHRANVVPCSWCGGNPSRTSHPFAWLSEARN